MIKSWIRKNVYNLTSFWLLLLIAITTIFSIPLFIYHYENIYFGLLIGLGLNFVYYLVLGLSNNKEKENKNFNLSLVLIISRFSLIIIIFTLIALFYFLFNLNNINVFALTGGLILPIGIYILCLRKEKTYGSI